MLRRLFGSRWFRGTAITVVVLLLVVTLVSLNAYFTLRNQGEAHQQQMLAHLDATDPGWRFEQIQAARQATLPPAEKNVIEQAVKLADRFPEEQFREWLTKNPPPPEPSHGIPPDAEEVAYSRQMVAMCRDLIPEARELRHLSGGRVVPLAENPLATLLPHVDKASRVASLLQHDATVSAMNGKIGDALDDVLAILAIARGLDDEPYLVSHLFRLRFLTTAVQATVRTIQLGDGTNAKLAEVETGLTEAVKVRGLVIALRGERAGMSKLADLLAKDPGQADGLIDPGVRRPPKAAVAVATSALLPETHARFLELMTRAIAIAEKPPGPDRDAEFAQIETEVRADTSLEGEALRLVLPAILRCYEADVRSVALLSATSVAVRAERYRLRHGRFPTDWREFHDPPPTDPYTAKPMLLKATTDWVAVYSTGNDRIDGGGDDLFEGGAKRGTDIGVRLYDVKWRK